MIFRARRPRLAMFFCWLQGSCPSDPKGIQHDYGTLHDDKWPYQPNRGKGHVGKRDHRHGGNTAISASPICSHAQPISGAPRGTCAAGRRVVERGDLGATASDGQRGWQFDLRPARRGARNCYAAHCASRARRVSADSSASRELPSISGHLRGRRLRPGGRRRVSPAAGRLPRLRPPRRQAVHGLRLLDRSEGPRPGVHLPPGALAVTE